MTDKGRQQKNQSVVARLSQAHKVYKKVYSSRGIHQVKYILFGTYSYLLPAHLEAHPAEEAIGEVDGAGRCQRVALRVETGVAAAL